MSQNENTIDSADSTNSTDANGAQTTAGRRRRSDAGVPKGPRGPRKSKDTSDLLAPIADAKQKLPKVRARIECIEAELASLKEAEKRYAILSGENAQP